MVLQFNPFFNYIFKPNEYINRAVRLLMLTNYFLMFSSISLYIFVKGKNEHEVPLIFSLSIVLWIVVILTRGIV
jgi:hypothetical protein